VHQCSLWVTCARCLSEQECGGGFGGVGGVRGVRAG
jgi:hypothetical protein